MITAIGFLYWAYTNWSFSTASSTAGSCGPFGWSTVVNTQDDATELARATLKSDHPVGPKGRESCFEIAFVCLPNSPYFELRVTNSNLVISGVEKITVGVGLSRVSLLFTEPPIDNGSAVRITSRGAVERIGQSLAGDDTFLAATAQVMLANNEAAHPRFMSLKTVSALRPVFFACRLHDITGPQEQLSSNDE
jgi:hypothetical protein